MASPTTTSRSQLRSSDSVSGSAAPFDVVRDLIDELASQARNPWAKFNLEAAAQTLRVLPADTVRDCPRCTDAASPSEQFRVAREALRSGSATESDGDNIQISLCIACLATAERYWS